MLFMSQNASKAAFLILTVLAFKNVLNDQKALILRIYGIMSLGQTKLNLQQQLPQSGRYNLFNSDPFELAL
ncbi:MAG: hypothetical protein ACI8O8_001557 [Oleiphilaceae bacterium]|jgi:hypothetical protein